MKLNQETIDKIRPEGTLTTYEYAKYKNIGIGAVKGRIKTNQIKSTKVGRNIFVYPETDMMFPDNFRPEGTLTIEEYAKQINVNKTLIMGRIYRKNIEAEKIGNIWFVYPKKDKLNPDNFRPKCAFTLSEYAEQINVDETLIMSRIKLKNIEAEKIENIWFVYPKTDKLNPDNFRPDGTVTISEYAKQINVNKALIMGRVKLKNIEAEKIGNIWFVYPKTDKLIPDNFRPEGTVTINEYANCQNLSAGNVLYRIKTNQIKSTKVGKNIFVYPETDKLNPDNFRPEGAITLYEYSKKDKIPVFTARARISKKTIEAEKIENIWFVYPKTDKLNPDNFRPEGAITLHEYANNNKILVNEADRIRRKRFLKSQKINNTWFIFPED